MGEAISAAAQDAEALLVRRAKQRSPSAWAEIYDRHYRQLYRYCYARAGDTSIAAELASRVYLEALEGIDKYEYRGRPLLAWLYRIARNLVSDYQRSRQRERKALERAASMLEPHHPGPEASVADRSDLHAALSQLTEDQQQLIALRFYADLSTAEIAETMGRSERAVYSLEVRALATMRKLIDAGEEESEQRRRRMA